ncbi:MAG: UDP-N-acetylglucosamine 1-carboxyvinyltransferase [Clostridia bacterium]|nr:UDP-N-acetylglucosamine 1-carboxyvinyltransferase [Clostridia bacterium]
MYKIIINGGNQLFGSVDVSCMKNAALPIIFATILTKSKCVIENLPAVSDVTQSLEILQEMGASVRFLNPTTVEINTATFTQGTAPFDLVSKMRGSTYLLGAELGRFGKANVNYPGGCDFGVRPIDQHIKGFEALGAKVWTENGYVNAIAENGLMGNSVYFDVTSVGATVNVILASVLAEGMTIIENAAREPHIVDLANFFNTCGANITGAGTSVIKIRGVKELHGCTYTIIPDMIEAGTFMVAAAVTGGRVRVTNIIPKHMETVSTKLIEMGVQIEEDDDVITVTSDGTLKGVNIKTLPYPGFPTDMHPQFGAALCFAEGPGIITEGIWESRFRYTEELRKMGANVVVEGKAATYIGKSNMSGARLTAVDLRGGAAVLIAALAAKGTSEITGIEVINRGYYNIVGKLRALGADIREESQYFSGENIG